MNTSQEDVIIVIGISYLAFDQQPATSYMCIGSILGGPRGGYGVVWVQTVIQFIVYYTICPDNTATAGRCAGVGLVN
jgi:hypothetical protein